MAGTTDTSPVTADDVARARAAIGDVARKTPILPSAVGSKCFSFPSTTSRWRKS